MKGDIRWTNRTIIKMTIFAVCGGMMTSLVGLGGGVIFNPLMISFGVHPKVSKATSLYMILLSTLSALFQIYGKRRSKGV
mmetsp:Transcript_15414/g.17861  ORF Transcript_15414/g.17861 Transcript_15414/m.17861 type:complete len:80 (-) Transcript_15414:7-246(-)